jgi:endogenous inhibitor of DNA gyrase (YacG/DUF329 family)
MNCHQCGRPVADTKLIPFCCVACHDDFWEEEINHEYGPNSEYDEIPLDDVDYLNRQCKKFGIKPW